MFEQHQRDPNTWDGKAIALAVAFASARNGWILALVLLFIAGYYTLVFALLFTESFFRFLTHALASLEKLDSRTARTLRWVLGGMVGVSILIVFLYAYDRISAFWVINLLLGLYTVTLWILMAVMSATSTKKTPPSGQGSWRSKLSDYLHWNKKQSTNKP